MKLLVINSGSSSIKYQLFDLPHEQPLCSGIVERIGLADALVTHRVTDGGHVNRFTAEIADHEQGMQHVVALLTSPESGLITDVKEIEVVGHRVVHGGEQFAATTLITPEVKAGIKQLFALAPLHNPAHYTGIEVAEHVFSNAAHVAVFDTAFHQTMPEKAFRYALPNEFYEQHGIRAYGFHGTSHKYVSATAIEYLRLPKAKVITIHLGNGCSMAAVNAGICVDTSMGLTPLDGLVMGTRSGSIDPSVLLYLMTKLNITPEKLNDLLNKESGMTGLTGFSDMREIKKRWQEGDPHARLAYELAAYRIKKFIGAYAAAMNGLDAIVFTAGIGENDALMRQLVCQDLDFLGIHLDPFENGYHRQGICKISSDTSRVSVLIVPTNEELEIARQCSALLQTC